MWTTCPRKFFSLFAATSLGRLFLSRRLAPRRLQETRRGRCLRQVKGPCLQRERHLAWRTNSPTNRSSSLPARNPLKHQAELIATESGYRTHRRAWKRCAPSKPTAKKQAHGDFGQASTHPRGTAYPILNPTVTPQKKEEFHAGFHLSRLKQYGKQVNAANLDVAQPIPLK